MSLQDLVYSSKGLSSRPLLLRLEPGRGTCILLGFHLRWQRPFLKVFAAVNGGLEGHTCPPGLHSQQQRSFAKTAKGFAIGGKASVLQAFPPFAKPFATDLVQASVCLKYNEIM